MQWLLTNCVVSWWLLDKKWIQDTAVHSLYFIIPDNYLKYISLLNFIIQASYFKTKTPCLPILFLEEMYLVSELPINICRNWQNCRNKKLFKPQSRSRRPTLKKSASILSKLYNFRLSILDWLIDWLIDWSALVKLGLECCYQHQLSEPLLWCIHSRLYMNANSIHCIYKYPFSLLKSQNY